MQSHRGHFVLAILIIGMAVASNNCFAQNGKPRPLAKGVLIQIDSDLEPRDTSTLPMVVPGLNATKFAPKTIPNEETLHGQSRREILFRDNVWQYEFSFTGLRQAKLKIPTGNGGVSNKNVWYMIYRVRDTNQTMTFDSVKDPKFDHVENVLKYGEKVADEKKSFTPRFTLEGWIANTKGAGYSKVTLRDSVDPIIVQQIRNREDANQVLLDTHQMSKAKIPAASNEADPGVWGVAVWEDVDPRIDYVSVFVKGLTNAFRLGRNDGDPSKLKTLQLNFWRPGDMVAEQNDRVAFGIPLVDDPRQQVLITQRYDLPGPVIRGYVVNKVAKRNVMVLEADAKVNLKDFKSALTPTLDQGKLPPSIAQAFAQAGVTVDKTAALSTVIQGEKWAFKQGEDEYVLTLEPQFWEPDFVGIRFIKSLDHMWIYR